MSIFHDVANFNDYAGVQTPFDALCHMVEEQGETAAALRRAVANPNDREAFEAAVDGCIDTIYVTVQLLAAMGLSADAMHRAWSIVQRSNMHKFPTCKTCEGRGELDEECGYARCPNCSGHGIMPPAREPSGKIIKPLDWVAPDFSSIHPHSGLWWRRTLKGG